MGGEGEGVDEVVCRGDGEVESWMVLLRVRVAAWQRGGKRFYDDHAC